MILLYFWRIVMSDNFNKNALKVGIGLTLTGIFVLANPVVYGIGIGVTAFSARRIFKPAP